MRRRLWASALTLSQLNLSWPPSGLMLLMSERVDLAGSRPRHRHGAHGQTGGQGKTSLYSSRFALICSLRLCCRGSHCIFGCQEAVLLGFVFGAVSPFLGILNKCSSHSPAYQSSGDSVT